MKILNLYAGIGGNRKLWTPNGDEHNITAIELDPKIAAIYHDFFPKDNVIVADAHQFLLDHFKEYEFIWSSPPCPTHSRINTFAMGKQNPMKFPEMKLYEEVIILQYYHKGKYCVENVISYYTPLIPPVELNSHYFWVNFPLKSGRGGAREHYGSKEKLSELKGFPLDKIKGVDVIKTLRNCVEPETGKYIFDQMLLAIKNDKSSLFDK